MMETSMRFGLMAVFAVSGSMVLLVHQVHKRLLSNFMEKFEFEMGVLCPHAKSNVTGCKKNQGKKKVRFAKQVLEVPIESRGCCRRKITSSQLSFLAEEVSVLEKIQKWRRGPSLEDTMPPNRAALYRGILKCKKGRFRC
ncbi:hypothetical protein HN51_060207 [Arachis hypogaea]|uniref:Uncharacterized protein n=1 Tax=Arachis hypogaea TaxID=3818 RepID=A0A444X8U5_ARAHY|nr:uncharacterized protein LOC107621351 [Arachis ipaensis]XP_025683412.1 uncharacterized protein LOC112784426 [Arachis hypogaea]QHN83793.1 uncharacterized protein DS421_20g707850 [Arachis hypogaea]RYQ86117.1 hypothetical protein Ahy_B10g105792 [Arachis hypogaea]